MICLDRRLAEFGATVDLLAEGDPALVEKPGAAFGIMGDLGPAPTPSSSPPKPRCRRPSSATSCAGWSWTWSAPAPSYRSQAAASEKLTREVAAAAAALPYPPLVAPGRVVTGVVQLDRGLVAEAEATWLRAIGTAIEGEDANALGLAAISLARLQAESLGKPQEAAPWLRIAEASIGHLRHQPILQASMLRLARRHRLRLGDNEAALADMKKAMAIAEGSGTALHQQAGIANDLGIVYSNLGRYAERRRRSATASSSTAGSTATTIPTSPARSTTWARCTGRRATPKTRWPCTSRRSSCCARPTARTTGWWR